MTTQRHEIEAWLGDEHGLTTEQVDQFQQAADEISARYPDEDDADERSAAMVAAYRMLAYRAATETAEQVNAYRGDNVWQDVILPILAESYGEDVPSDDDGVDDAFALATGMTIRYDTQLQRWHVIDEDDPVAYLASDLTRARLAESRALAGLRQAAVMAVGGGGESEAGFARRAGVDRMAVRGWLGKR